MLPKSSSRIVKQKLGSTAQTIADTAHTMLFDHPACPLVLALALLGALAFWLALSGYQF